jgi:hypothetical protein
MSIPQQKLVKDEINSRTKRLDNSTIKLVTGEKMDIETILKIAALSIGALIILSNFVRFDSLFARLLPKKKVPQVVVQDNKEDEKFLHIINLWYQLKDNCDSYGLQLAVDKLDEVFPLLNNKKDESAE